MVVADKLALADPYPLRRRCFVPLRRLPFPSCPAGSISPEEKRWKLVADLIAEIEAEAAVRRLRTGSQVLGASAVRGQHPFDRPKKSKKSPAPWFHAASKAVRQELTRVSPANSKTRSVESSK
jgi:hypothetical protein